MKKFIVLLAGLLITVGCKEKKEEPYIPESSGVINNVSVIIDNELWNSPVGDSIRYVLAAEVEGLTHAEPLFNLNQYPTNIFKGFMRNSRNIVIVAEGKEDVFAIEEDRFAKPQNVVFVTGTSNEAIIQLFKKNAEAIVKSIQRMEVKERQQRIKKALLNTAKIEKELGVTLSIPTAYAYAMEREKFFWLKKEIPSGNSSVLIYEVPTHKLENDTTAMANVIAVRDSIGKQHIHGTLDNTYMGTEVAYAPYFYQIDFKEKPTYLTKGSWELRNDFMAGPFINYAIKDEKNNRYVVVEGFVYAPSKPKRDLVQELESIILSVEIQ